MQRQQLSNFLKILDVVTMAGVFILSVWVTQTDKSIIAFSEILSVRIELANFLLFGGFIFIWHLVFSLLGMYQWDLFDRNLRTEAVNTLTAVTVGSSVLYSVSHLFSVEIVTAEFLVVFLFASLFIFLGTRPFLRNLFKHTRRSNQDRSHILIVGANERSLGIARAMQKNQYRTFSIIGFVDESNRSTEKFVQEGYKIVSDFSGFQDFIRNNVVDEVIMCVPLRSSYDQARRLVAMCEVQGIAVRLLTDIFHSTELQTRLDYLAGTPTVALVRHRIENQAAIVKRAIDLTIVSTSLIILLPFFLLIGLAIKLDSPGPVFFSQKRLGLNKRLFNLYKFRTMVTDAEMQLTGIEHLNEANGPVFKIKNDPRITRVGGLLRKTSLDELPQLLNILKGEMSLVGPRPLPVRDCEGFTVDWHRRRFTVRPGVTCLWQIKGRSDVAFDQWMELDMEYIDRWTIWLDMKILFMTIPAVIRGVGAH